jgi:hypothetical protein
MQELHRQSVISVFYEKPFWNLSFLPNLQLLRTLGGGVILNTMSLSQIEYRLPMGTT